MKVGDLVFVKSNTFMGKMIRLVSTGKFNQDVPNHVAIVTMMIPGETILIEATYGGVRLIPLETYADSKIWVKRIQDPKDVKKGLDWAFKQLYKSRKYDYSSIVGIFLRSFWRLCGPGVYKRVRKVRNFLDSKQRFFCSEYSSKYAKETGQTLRDTPDSMVTPFDIWRSSKLYEVDDHQK